MQKRKLWKDNFEVRPVGNGRKERTLGSPSDAVSRQIRCGPCRGISPLLIASCLSHWV